MRRSAIALLGVSMLGAAIAAAPVAATAQTDTPPLVVESLKDPAPDPAPIMPWVGTVAGATVAIVGANAWTGGALLAPAVGPMISSTLGGSWLGLSALTPIGAQSFMQTTSLLAIGVAGGVFGHWLAER